MSLMRAGLIRLLILLTTCLVTSPAYVLAETSRCEGLFKAKAPSFDLDLFQKSLQEFKGQQAADIEVTTPEQLLAFIEIYSSFRGISTLRISEFLEKASWLQTKMLLWHTRKLKGQGTLNEKQLDKIVAHITNFTQKKGVEWGRLKKPQESVKGLFTLSDRLIKNNFDQVLARSGLAAALTQSLRFAPGKPLREAERNFMKFLTFTFLNIVGVTGSMGLHPLAGLDPYMPEMNVLRDKMAIENLVERANQVGYEQALSEFQVKYANFGQRQSFYEVFKSVYNFVGRILVVSFFVGAGHNLYTAHEHTVHSRQAVVASVSENIRVQDLIRAHSDITNPDLLGMLVFEEYFKVAKSKNPSLNEMSPEIQNIRAQIIEQIEEIKLAK